MSTDHTQQQTDAGRTRAAELSLKRTLPPSKVPGYEIQEFLGSGAYGEVWVGIDRKTKRRVAIKFFTRRAELEFSLLTAEVEKLVFLSTDRYVVQLLDVGLDADPPYYVMDYIENGSLEDELRRRGTFSVGESIDMFYEMATGLTHLHNRGILHCDLKPGNVLLDQDHKPRLADFGQSRLAHEQSPALGTLFFMAPEQADLDAIPDSRWDVYALGAVIYTMLTGKPPYRNEGLTEQIESGKDIADRLARYRALIGNAPKPSAHRQVRGMDRGLADIVDRCIASDPEDRYESVQSVVLALKHREENRSRRPVMILGLVGPLVLSLIMLLFGLGVYNQSVNETEQSLREKAQESNGWAAQFAARAAGDQIDSYFDDVERLARDPRLSAALRELRDSTRARQLLAQLDNPADNTRFADERAEFVDLPERQSLQQLVEEALDDTTRPEAASWFVCDQRGMQVASAFRDAGAQSTIGKNYSFRTYFHGDGVDWVSNRPDGEKGYEVAGANATRKHIDTSHISAVFSSQATDTWKVAFSTPIWLDNEFAGVIAVTVEMGSFVEFDNRDVQFAMLVDGRNGPNRGLILEHPLFDEIRAGGRALPKRFGDYRIDLESINGSSRVFRDPLADDDEGEEFRRDWIAARRDVRSLHIAPDPADKDGQFGATGLSVIALEDADEVIAPAHLLGNKLARLGMWALIVVILVATGMWYLVMRTLRDSRARVGMAFSGTAEATSVFSARTIPAPKSNTRIDS